MRVLIASDSFKEALDAKAVCEAIARGLQRAGGHITPTLFPLADGGEGTAEILAFHSGGQMVSHTVNDPLFRTIEAQYGRSADGQTAFIETAAAAGLQRLKPEERNPLKTTSYGTGELMLHAIENGAKNIILGLGGSATNDAGIGMASALGFRFLDEQGNILPAVGESLHKIAHIDNSHLKVDLSKVTFTTLCDVDNPLHGPRGAARVYAAQKGADEAAVDLLDAGLQKLGQLLDDLTSKDISNTPGSGAAGGLGAGSLAFINAELKPGITTVMALTAFEEALEGQDYIITGEGRLDEQTLHGKLIKGITERARQRDIPVIALCGSLGVRPEAIEEIGLQAAFSIQNRPVDLPTALQETAERLEASAYQLGRVLGR